MIRVDIKRYIYDRVWFGYARQNVFEPWGQDMMGGTWVRKWVKVK